MANNRGRKVNKNQDKENPEMTASTDFDQAFDAADTTPAESVAEEATAEAAPELAEVDTPEALDDEETDAPAEPAATGTATPATATASTKTPRQTAPEGYVKPVEMAKVLTAHLAEKGATNKHGAIRLPSEGDAGNVIPPQQMYSMLKGNERTNVKNPIPTYAWLKDGGVVPTAEVNGRPTQMVYLLKADEVLKWWDEKDGRVAASKEAAAAKAAKKAAAPAAEAAPTENEAESTEPVVEAE
jgi:hypothetical protein